PEKKQIHKRNNVHSETSDIEFKTSKEVKRFPHKRIDAPFREEDFNCYKIFYGNVDYCWEPDKQKGKILLYRTNENKLLCKITVSKGVAKYLPEKYKTVKRTSYTVAFVAKFDLNNNQCKSYLTTYLRYSNYFILDKGAALA
ncbi:MAG: hypothetical protein PHE09_21310, partial [Oscillospiraceae bacterium]|nr:hypothetical protein [Oscillospiraceae bacterium]